jgi:hypothetical protein
MAGWRGDDLEMNGRKCMAPRSRPERSMSGILELGIGTACIQFLSIL